MKNFIVFMMVMTLMAVVAMGATFNSKVEAEAYVADLNSYSKMSVEIIGVEGSLNSDMQEVMWQVVIYKQSQRTVRQCTINEKTMREVCINKIVMDKDILHQEIMSTSVSSSDSDAKVKATIMNNAENWQNVWSGQQKYFVRKGLAGHKEVKNI